MSYLDGDIEIGRNCVRYYDEIVKISNISRIYIFRFFNREKKEYEARKRSYEMNERLNKNKKIKAILVIAVLLLLIALYCFSKSNPIGVALVVLAGFCGYWAYKTAKQAVVFDQEEHHPDKYGLNIEMNSGQSVIFSAVGADGLRALRSLQNEINEADTLHEVTIFNMNDNHIEVENNDGIISTGDNAENQVTGGGRQ